MNPPGQKCAQPTRALVCLLMMYFAVKSSSWPTSLEPLVVEVEGQTRRLTGSAEEKYREWRKILREIYAAETGGVFDAELPEPGSAAGSRNDIALDR